MSKSAQKENAWLDQQGHPLSCHEKLKVLDQSLIDLQQEAQDVFEDGLLMGVDEQQLKDRLIGLLSTLENPYSK